MKAAPVHHPPLSRVTSHCTRPVRRCGHAHWLPARQQCIRQQSRSTNRMQYQADSTHGGETAPQLGNDRSETQHGAAVQLTPDQVMSDMRTMLGGISTERFTGYAGQWRTWEVIPSQQHTGPNGTSADSSSLSSATTSDTPSGTRLATPPAAISSSSGRYGIRLIDDSINVRLWRAVTPDEPRQSVVSSRQERPQAQTVPIQQANFYHHPGKMAGPSTRFAQYLTGNTMSGRPDGYGLRVWSFTKDSEMLQPDASSWLTGQGTPAECSMCVLTVPHVATTIINGALPSGFEEGHTPRFWVLEFIAKEASSAQRRWASMNWYDLGELVVNRSINEDLLHLNGEPDDVRIQPDNIHFSTRREGLLPLDIDSWAGQHTLSQQGTATLFTFTSDNTTNPQRLQLTRTPDVLCCWTNPFATVGTQSTPAAAVAHGSQATHVATGASSTSQPGDQQQQQQQQDGLGVDVVCQVYPDLSYCRVPRSIKQVVGSGSDTAVFEAGTVMRDSTLVRWLLEYDTSGKRLIRTARFETYPAAQQWA